MSRRKGQIDIRKREAILTAARAVIVYPPAPPPVLRAAAVARKAGVSKQTIYNHFGSLGALIDAIAPEPEKA